MKIKSLEELEKIRQEHSKKVSLRDQGSQEGKTEVLIGMATCGISSGARETMNEFIEEITREGLDDVKVITVGCIGYCHSEPVVQINVPGKEPVLYGKVKKDRVHEIVEEHLKNGKLVDSLILQRDFERA